MTLRHDDDVRRRRSGFTLVELLVVISIIVLLATLLVPKLMDTQEKAKMAQCTVNLRNLHLACMQYADTENLFPGGNEAPGVVGFQQLIKAGYLSQIKTVVCPSSVDTLKTLDTNLRGGSVKPGQEDTVANALKYSLSGAVGTISYYFTGKLIPQSLSGGRPLCTDANHNAEDTAVKGVQFNGAAPDADNHGGGFHVLTNDGAIEFVKLKKDPARINETKTEMQK